MARKHQHLSGELVSPESLVGDPASGGDGYSAGASNDDWLRLAQAPEREPPASDFPNWLSQQGKGFSAQTFMQNFAEFTSPCEGDGTLCVEIQVHKSRSDLDYSIRATRGVLSEQFDHVGEIAKTIKVRQTDTITLENQVVGELSTSWDGDVEGLTGKIVPPPEVTAEGNVLTFSEFVVIGNLRIGGAESHDTYTLTITPRAQGEYDPQDPESAYESTVIAVWDGDRVKELDVVLPKMDGNCSGSAGGITAINGGDGDGDGEKCWRLIEVRDGCTEEVISERREQIACPDTEEAA